MLLYARIPRNRQNVLQFGVLVFSLFIRVTFLLRILRRNCTSPQNHLVNKLFAKHRCQPWCPVVMAPTIAHTWATPNLRALTWSSHHGQWRVHLVWPDSLHSTSRWLCLRGQNNVTGWSTQKLTVWGVYETTRHGNDGGNGDGNNDDANGDSGDDVNFGNIGDGDGSRGWQRWW